MTGLTVASAAMTALHGRDRTPGQPGAQIDISMQPGDLVPGRPDLESVRLALARRGALSTGALPGHPLRG